MTAALIHRPRYSPAEASRLVHLKPDRIRRWLSGYSFTYKSKSGEKRRGNKAPVLQHPAGKSAPFASFLDLVDLLFVKRFVETGIPLQKLRLAFEEARNFLGTPHFARRKFFTDGKNVYLEVRDKEKDAVALLELLSGGQWVIAPVILAIAQRIDFDDGTGFAERWYPLGRDLPVVIDPAVAFGAPSVKGKGIKTANVADLYHAEKKNMERVCFWTHLSVEEVKAAVDFECSLKAA